MARMRRTGVAVLALTLGVWFAAIVGAGAMAALAFPTLRELDPSVPAYQLYEGPHWSLAAGVLAERGFRLSDRVQVVCAVLALLLAWCLPRDGSRTAGRLAVACLALATGGLVYQLGLLRPRMDEHVVAYRVEAREGRAEDAARHKAAFDALHPSASRALSFTALAVAGAIVCVAYAGMPGRPDK